MNNKDNPLSLRNLLAFLGINMTLGSMLSVVANIIQILTVANGVAIFLSVFIITSIFLIFRVRAFLQLQREMILENQKQQDELQIRLQRIKNVTKTRLTGNPRPDEVSKWVSVKKIIANNATIQIIEITEADVIVDKGGKDGLVNNISCKIKKKGSSDSEDSEIFWADPDDSSSIIKHSGQNLSAGDDPQLYLIELIIPDITSTEKFIGNVLLVAEGYEPDWS